MTKEQESQNDFDRLFGQPALLNGESRDIYNQLRAKVAAELKAKDDIFSQLKVQEVTDSIWESRRFKRFGIQSVESAMLTALEYLLQPACAGTPHSPLLLAGDYYSNKPETKKAAHEIVARLGITPDTILGQAVAMSGEFGLFDRLADNRASRYKQLLKHHDKQLRKAEKREAALARQRQPARPNDNLAPPKKDAA